MNITNSPDLTILLVDAVFNLLDPAAKITMKNLSTGAHLANVKYAFEVYAPSGEVIHKNTFPAWSVSGAFTSFDIPQPIPKFQGSVEWSGAAYRVVVSAKDSAGNVYKLPEKRLILAMPAGNNRVGNSYGEGKLDIKVNCTQAQSFIKDITPYSYQGHKGKLLSGSSMTIIEPADQSGNFPEPTVYGGFAQVLHPLRVSGKGYRVVLQSNVEYDMGEGVIVWLKYIKTQGFDVNCNYDLCPLLIRMPALLEKAAVECDPLLDRKVATIGAKMTMAAMAKVQPTCGIDLGKLIDEIKELAGWHDCDCECGGYIGINGNQSVTSGSGLNIDFNLAGDLTGSADVEGNNILFNLSDLSYVVALGTNMQEAFTIEPSTTGKVKTYTVNVDYEDLSEQILEAIDGSQNLTALLNTIVAAAGNFEMVVDGKCVVATSSKCDYTITYPGIPPAPSTIMFKWITIDGIRYNIYQNFNRTTGLDVIKTKLDALGKGTFNLVASAGTMNLTTTANPYSITEVVLFGGNAGLDGDKDSTIVKSNCTGKVAYTPSQIVQSIIDYLCKINISQVYLGKEYTWCEIQNDGTLKTVKFAATDSLAKFMDAVSNNSCMLLKLSTGGKTLTYDDIAALFTNTSNTLRSTDFVFGIRDGIPGRWSRADMVTAVINAITTTNDPALIAAWNKAVSIGGSTAICNPVTFTEVTLRPLVKEDFTIVGADLLFSGRKTNLLTLIAVTATFTQKDALGNTGTQYSYVVPSGSSKISNVFSAAPALPTGYFWTLTNISYASSGNNMLYLAANITNNGASSYKISARKSDSTTPFVYTTVPADAGQNTVVLFAVPAGDYQVSTIAVCGPTSESQPVQADSIGCKAPGSFSVAKVGTNWRVSYQLPTGVTRMNLRIEYPNGGAYDQIHTGDNSVGLLVVPVPEGITGDFKFFLRSVCNEAAQWYSRFTNPVNLNAVPQSISSCPSIAGATITNITQTTAVVNLTAAGNMSGAQFLTLLLTRAGGQLSSYQVQPDATTYTLNNLTPGSGYSLKVRTECANGESSTPYEVPEFQTLAAPNPGTQRIAYYGSSDTVSEALAMTVDQYKAAGTQVPYTIGAAVRGNWTNITVPKVLWILIPYEESVRVRWEQPGNTVNGGPIGAFPKTFNGPAVKGTNEYRLYYANFATQQNDGPLDFFPTA